MSAANKDNPNECNEGCVPGWGTAIMSAFFMGLIVLDFFSDPDKHTLTPTILVGMALVVIVLFASSFDSLSIAQLITLKKSVKEEVNKRHQAEERVSELSAQLVSLTASFSAQIQSSQQVQSNQVTNHHHYPQQVVPASPADKDTDDQDLQEELNKQSGEPKKSDSGEAKAKDMNKVPFVRIDHRKIEEIALNHLASELGLPITEFSREVKLTEPDNMDRITTNPPIFDAFVQTGRENIFIEIKAIRPSRGSISMIMHFRDQFSRLLALVDLYGKSLRIRTKLIIVLALLDKDGQESQDATFPKRDEKGLLEAYFAPAIARGILEIKTITLDPKSVERQ